MIRSQHRVGKRFGRLLITAVYRENGKTYADILCDCGKSGRTVLDYILNGHKKSCGCWHEENLNRLHKGAVKHSLHRHPLYGVWQTIKGRCLNPNHYRYQDYGGRGITICNEWKNDFLSFFDWAIANGWERGLEIDRYPDNNGGYYPSNCRMATASQNSRNKRSNLIVEYKGEKMLLIELKERLNLNIKIATLKHRYHAGWSIEQLVKPPTTKIT